MEEFYTYILVVVIRIVSSAVFVQDPFPLVLGGALVSQRAEALAIRRCSSDRKHFLERQLQIDGFMLWFVQFF